MLLLPSSSTDLRSRGTEKVAICGVNSAGEGRGGCLEVAKLGFSLLPHCKFELEFLQFCSMGAVLTAGEQKKLQYLGSTLLGKDEGHAWRSPNLVSTSSLTANLN